MRRGDRPDPRLQDRMKEILDACDLWKGSLVEHSLAELESHGVGGNLVWERLDAIHERSQREAWLLGQLVEARRQIDAAADRLRAIEERLTP